MKQLKFETGVVFGQENDSLDLADMPTAMIMAATFLEEAVLDRYNLSITCWAGQNKNRDMFCIKLFEDTGKIPETDESLNKLWCDLAETANELQRRAGDNPAIDFDTEEGCITVTAPEYCIDLLAVISDSHQWDWRDAKACFDRGYSYCLNDLAQMVSLSKPQNPKQAPALRLH